ncbi:MAG: hypothetical protein ACLKAL_10900 [Alkaliphilus sp.]
MVSWRFPSNDYGQYYGINDAGMHHFAGTPLRSLAREICQNSLDAGNGGAVRVEFDLFDMDKHKIPDYEYLKFAFHQSREYWGEQKDSIAKDFFDKALDLINEEKIKILRISDYSTSGLTGSGEEWNTNWTNLTKSAGASDKKEADGGSFGIGKFATFACSDFRTVFYSTLDENGIMASQGVARLVSFIEEKGKAPTQGTGYYGKIERNTPLTDMLILQDGFKRTEVGTDIFIVAFSHDSDWEEEMVISVIDDFIGAIWKNNLVITIGEYEICKNSLRSLIVEFEDSISKHAKDYYEILTSEETNWFEEDFMSYGTVRLGLKIAPELNRRVAMIRKTGMKIMDQGAINANVPFAGVMFIEGTLINKLLRKMENPQHTKWEPNRVKDKAGAKKILKNLKVFIRREINRDGSF